MLLSHLPLSLVGSSRDLQALFSGDLVTVTAAAKCPLWMSFGSRLQSSCLLLFQANTLVFCASAWGRCSCGAGLVSMKMLTHGQPGKPLQGNFKMHLFLRCEYRRSCDKSWKRRIVSTELGSMSCMRRVKVIKIVGREKDITEKNDKRT